MKLPKKVKFKDKQKYLEEAIEYMVELVQKWADQKMITRVIMMDNKVKSKIILTLMIGYTY